MTQDFYGVSDLHTSSVQTVWLGPWVVKWLLIANRRPRQSVTHSPRFKLLRLQLSHFLGATSGRRSVISSIVKKDVNITIRTASSFEDVIQIKGGNPHQAFGDYGWNFPARVDYPHVALWECYRWYASTSPLSPPYRRWKRSLLLNWRAISHRMTRAVSALESIRQSITNSTVYHHRSYLLVYLMVELLHIRSRREWENTISGTSELLTYNAQRRFVECRLKALNLLKSNKTSLVASTKVGGSGGRSARTLHADKQKASRSQCILCEKCISCYSARHSQIDARER